MEPILSSALSCHSLGGSISPPIKKIYLDELFPRQKVILEINGEDKDPLAKKTYNELIQTKEQEKLNYIIAVIQDVADLITYHMVDAVSLKDRMKHHTQNPFTNHKIEKIYWYTIGKSTDDSFTYLGHSKEIGDRKLFLDYFSLANLGDQQAQFYLAICYINGIGTVRSETKAIHYLTLSLNHGFLEAYFQLKDLNKTVETNYWKDQINEIEKLSEKGDSQACCMLGLCYLNGFHVRHAQALAIELLEKAASKGSSSAFYHLGVIYFENNELSKAHKMWLEAKRRSHPLASLRLKVIDVNPECHFCLIQ